MTPRYQSRKHLRDKTCNLDAVRDVKLKRDRKTPANGTALSAVIVMQSLFPQPSCAICFEFMTQDLMEMAKGDKVDERKMTEDI
jgi:hypothetical protein